MSPRAGRFFLRTRRLTLTRCPFWIVGSIESPTTTTHLLVRWSQMTSGKLGVRSNVFLMPANICVVYS